MRELNTETTETRRGVGEVNPGQPGPELFGEKLSPQYRDPVGAWSGILSGLIYSLQDSRIGFWRGHPKPGRTRSYNWMLKHL